MPSEHGTRRADRPGNPYGERQLSMPAFPALTHVAVTVSDLSASRRWYTRLFGAEPVLDEDTGEFHHVVYAVGGTLFGLHSFPGSSRRRSPRAVPAWTTSRSG